MRNLLFGSFVCFAGFVFSQEKPQDYVAAFELADAMREDTADDDETVAAFMLCLEMAVAAGDANYANAAGLNACHQIYGKGKIKATGELAVRILAALAPLPPQPTQIMRRVQFFGFMERGFLSSGKLGEAMRANRAAAETLRGNFVEAAADGRALTLEEAIALPPALRGFGWRLLEREANHLDMIGRTIEAVGLLDAAARFFGNDWGQSFGNEEQFYAFKLLAARAELKDFLGEKEQALSEQLALTETRFGNQSLAPSRAVLRINYLRNLSQWEGPSEEILLDAREVAAELKRLRSPEDADRLVAKMEFDLRKSRESADAMADSAGRLRLLGNDLEAHYADRDHLDALSRLGEAGLDERYFKLLANVRRKGIKCAEPNLFRMYGDYLMAQKRHGEAIAMYADALRLTRSFGWRLHEPALLGSLFEARIESGDIAGARAVLAEMDDFIRRNGDAPAQRLLLIHATRAESLARLGEMDGAHTAFAHARRSAESLPAYQSSYVSVEAVARFLAKLAEPKPAVANDAAMPFSVQPLEVTSVAIAGGGARTTFSVFNPSSVSISGTFEITGPAASLQNEGRLAAFKTGGDAASLSIPRRISSGEAADLVCAATGAGSADIRVAWKSEDGTKGPDSVWSVLWDNSARGRVVMDASDLEASPFRHIRLRHELTVPLGETRGIAFRMRSAAPLRMEYRDARSGTILAIDANGDGHFTGHGDFHLFRMDGQAAAVFPLDGLSEKITAEVFVFAPDGKPLPHPGSPLILEAEVFRSGKWIKEAEDVIR